MQTGPWLKSSHISPVCEEQGHEIKYTFVSDAPMILYQHGDNPEAVLRIDESSFNTRFSSPTRTSEEVHSMLMEWVERIHAYENA